MSRFFADLSEYQPGADLGAYRRAGHRLVSLKATEGLTYRDPLFAARWRQARAVGLRRMAYHFARPQIGRTGRQEAEHFLAVVREAGLTPRDFLALDLEWAAPGLPTWLVVQYADEFEATIDPSGYAAHFVIYGSPAFLEAHGIRERGRRRRRLWLADWAPRAVVPAGFRRWWAWQRSDGRYGPGPHALPGVGPCDVSQLNRRTYARILMGR